MSVIRTEVRTTIRGNGGYGTRSSVDFSLERTRSPDGTNFTLDISTQGSEGNVDVRLADLTIEDLQGLREALQLIPLEGSCQ